MRIPGILGTVLAAALLGACGGGDPCPAGGKGAIEVEVAGLPDGTAPRAKLTSAAGSKDVTAAGVIEDLGSGPYDVTVQTVATRGGVVRAAYEGSAELSQVCVKEGAPAKLKLAYTLIPSSAKLWVAGGSKAGGEVVALDAAKLESSGEVNAAVSLGGDPAIASPEGLTFDPHGNLWVVDASGSLQRFPAAALGESSKRAPDVRIDGDALSGSPGPTDLAFDNAGDLFVTVAAKKSVIRFSPDQLQQSGSPAPASTLSGFDAPGALAFDTAGNLWVADADGIEKFITARLQKSDSGAPDLRITARPSGHPAEVLTKPSALAFDTTGNLWVAYQEANTIVRLSTDDLAGQGEKSASPWPQIVLNLPTQLRGLAFDEEGHLWTAYGTGKLGRLSPTDLTKSGVMQPHTIIDCPDVGAAKGLAVYPARSFTPLPHRLP